MPTRLSWTSTSRTHPCKTQPPSSRICSHNGIRLRSSDNGGSGEKVVLMRPQASWDLKGFVLRRGMCVFPACVFVKITATFSKVNSWRVAPHTYPQPYTRDLYLFFCPCEGAFLRLRRKCLYLKKKQYCLGDLNTRLGSSSPAFLRFNMPPFFLFCSQGDGPLPFSLQSFCTAYLVKQSPLPLARLLMFSFFYPFLFLLHPHDL